MDDLDESNDMGENFVYDDGIPYEENIYQINADLDYSHWKLYNVLLLSQNYLLHPQVPSFPSPLD